MITISLCMIVKNEEAVLERCLNSICSAADEIIIVDTGSTDSTKKIAGKFADKVFNFPWRDDFSAARNFSFSKASMDYCLWLDADDVISPESLAGLLSLKNSLSETTDVVMLPYACAFHQDGSPSFVYYRERLIRNHAGFQWAGRVHECISPAGEIVHGTVLVEHHKPAGCTSGDRNLLIYEKMLAEGIPLNARDRFYYARELFYHAKYSQARENFIQVINDDTAWSENQIDACRLLAQCENKLENPRKALAALFESFRFDTPRAEILYDIGMHFQKKKKYRQAIYWYELALTCQENPAGGGFVEKDYYGYYPSLQLCVCWYACGDSEKAYDYHKRSGRWHTDTPEYLHNEAFFRQCGFPSE